ncbi:MAG: MurR/RpiR family transcriptional regulator [Armatimonadota bacterium]|nr:MurR/RpiR family transcriptional regulator [Armatimonadota bacterium]
MMRESATKAAATWEPARPAYDDLIQRIRDRLDQMSNGYRQVADYILEHYDRAAFLTAAKLGRTVGVSESTVVRFATALGYGGYPELQGVLQEIVKSRLTTVDRVIGSADTLGSEEDILTAVMQGDIENLRLTLRDLDRKAFHAAVSMLRGARRILVVGLRSSAALALFLGFNLDWILGNVKVAGFVAQDVWEHLVHLGREDVVVGISFPRYTKATVQALAAARERRCKIIALTDSVVSPLSKYADVVLAARDTVPAYTDSFVAPLSIINALLAATSMADRARTTRNLRRLEELWKEYGVYHQP